ncbi:MAG: ATP-binding cassette domain-containing protein [Spirochaetales bacterium]|nr:ATP-binding cassette domain-containing protein [Spirochaetales bacterium]
MVLEVDRLNKSFKSPQKEPGLKGQLKRLVKPTYREIRAVRDVSFSVEKGEMLAFIGPNGAGKSTTIKLITGILYPDSGTLSVLGMEPHRQRKALALQIGTVFGQKSQLWYHLPASDSFNLLGSIYNMSAGETDRRVSYLTEMFDLGDFVDQPVRKLSLGQRIRCEIAASLIHSPEILFLDEPSIGLDVVVKSRVRDLIKRLNEESGITVFLTSHDAGDIEKLCRRVIVINEGTAVWDGTVNDMKYTLLNRRLVDIKLEEELKLNMPGVTIVENNPYSAKLEVDLNQTDMKGVMENLIRHNSLRDINITTIPMEEIISLIYEGLPEVRQGEPV